MSAGTGVPCTCVTAPGTAPQACPWHTSPPRALEPVVHALPDGGDCRCHACVARLRAALHVAEGRCAALEAAWRSRGATLREALERVAELEGQLAVARGGAS